MTSITSAVTVPARTRRGRRPGSHRMFTIALMTPAAIGLTVFFVYPLFATVYFSFTRFDLLSSPQWVGLRNYRYFFSQDPYVWQSLRNTLWLAVVLVPCRILFALGTAGIITQFKRRAGLLRTLYYLPALAPPVAATVAFVFLFNPAVGPVNQVLGYLHLGQPGWFTDATWAKPALVLLGLWGVGDLMIIFLASLLDVPKDQYEAASLDGANGLQRFRYVTIPSIKPVLLFAAITGIVDTLCYFTQATVAAQVASGQANEGAGTATTLGFPNGSTLFFTQWLYQQGFTNFYLGYASAMSVLMFLLAIGFIVVLLRRSGSFRAGGS
jgi:multiple sugar transport system permease protein